MIEIAHQIYMFSFLNKEAAKGFLKRQGKNDLEISTLIADINLIDERIEPKRSNRTKASKIGKGKIQLK